MHANYCFVYLCFALLTIKTIFIVNLFHFYHIFRSFAKILFYVSPGMSQKKPGLPVSKKFHFALAKARAIIPIVDTPKTIVTIP